MKKEQFWQIIDETNRSMQDHDQETYFCRIVEALLHREREDILDWQEILNEYGRAAYQSDLWDKSLELGIHSEEEGFSSFRLWLVSRGKDVYLNVLRNPQTLEALVQTCEEPHFEKLDYAAYYMSTTGFRYKLLTENPDICKAVDDILLDFAGEDNPRRACNYGLTEKGIKAMQDAADQTLPHTYAWFVITDCNTSGEHIFRDLTLEEAIHTYLGSDRPEKRIGVTKDGIATVDLVRSLDGEQQFFTDHLKLDSFKCDPEVAAAVETLRLELEQNTPQQGMTMGGLS